MIVPPFFQQTEPPPRYQYTWAIQNNNGEWQITTTGCCDVVRNGTGDSTLPQSQKIHDQGKVPPAFALFFNKPLSVNTCQEQDLTMIPGIGPRLARAIVTTREMKGSFTAPEDLLDVPGIGPITLQRFLPYISFE